MDPRRRAAVGGIVGPGAFVGAWVLGGSLTGGYDPVDDPISRLAAVGAETGPLMTAGFVIFGLGVSAYAWAVDAHISRAAALAAGLTAVSTLAVAALPLDRSASIDTAHGVAAGMGYATLAATPLLAAGPLWRRDHRMLATAGVAAGLIAAASLAITATGAPTGLFQRLGLTVADAWIVASAGAIVGGRIATCPSRAARSGRS